MICQGFKIKTQGVDDIPCLDRNKSYLEQINFDKHREELIKYVLKTSNVFVSTSFKYLKSRLILKILSIADLKRKISVFE